jgi:hypothetical protein
MAHEAAADITSPYTRHVPPHDRYRELTEAIDRLADDLHAALGSDTPGRQVRDVPPELAGLVATLQDLLDDQRRRARNRAETDRQQTLTNERDRISHTFNDLVVRRVFALGLAIQRVGVQEPALFDLLQPLVEETDRLIHDTRTSIFRAGQPTV